MNSKSGGRCQSKGSEVPRRISGDPHEWRECLHLLGPRSRASTSSPWAGLISSDGWLHLVGFATTIPWVAPLSGGSGSDRRGLGVASLGATRVGADALTYVLPAPIRRINSGSSTPGWQCMFGPSPYIGVLSPEQRPWRRSCHHRSCRSWCWRWNRIWLSHSAGVNIVDALPFAVLLMVHDMRFLFVWRLSRR